MTKCSNQFNYILTRMTAHFQLVYQVQCAESYMTILCMDSAELINNELKCLNRCLKSNKISINADITKYMLFSYNKNVNFPIITIGNNKINETSVTKLLGIEFDKKLNFVNHITGMSANIAKSIGLLYKLNRFLTKPFLKRYILRIFIHIYHMAWNISKLYLKIFVLQKKAICAINNLACNEHTNAYFKCNKILQLSDQYKLQVSNHNFNYYTPILMKKWS